MSGRAAPIRSFLRRPLENGWADERDCILTKPVFDHDNSIILGAAYRADGSLILESLRPGGIGHWRHGDPVTLARYKYGPATERLDTAIYAGHFFNMWGHFLLETLSTAARARELPRCPVVFAPFAMIPGDTDFLAEWARFGSLLSAVWGDRPLILQTAALRIDRLIVPERLTVYGPLPGERGLADQMGDIYRAIRTDIAGNTMPARPMVACRPLWSERRHPAEEQLYQLLEARGCLLANGMDMTPRAQVETFAGASALIGFAGSNLHNSVFCHDGVPILEIGDVRSYTGATDLRNGTQVTMSDLLDQPVTFIDSFHLGAGPPIPFSAPELADAIFRKLGQCPPGSETDQLRRFLYTGILPG